MNLINLNHIIDEIIFNLNNKKSALQSAVNFGIIPAQSQKTTASRDKLNYLSQANDSTPFNRAFFVRNIRTPKEYADFVFNLNPIILSMVERNGQPLVVGCLPVMAVSHPVTFYRQAVRSLAVDSENSSQESTQMYQFIFAAIRRTDLSNQIQKIRIITETEQAARAKFARDFVLVLTGKINLQNTVKNNRTFAGLPTLSTSVVMGVAHA